VDLQTSKNINCHCCFTPPELLESFDLNVKRFVAPGSQISESRGELHPGICSWCKSLLGSGTEGFHFGSCTCDQMSRSLDILGMRAETEVNLFHMPATRSVSAYNFYREELDCLVQTLESLTGQKFSPDSLREQIKKRNSLRKNIRDFRENLSGSEFANLVHNVMEGNFEIFQPEKSTSSSIPKIAIAGSPTSRAEISWLKNIEKFPVDIVFDATCTGDRYIELRMEEDTKDPLDAVAKAYFYQTPCIRARPNTEFFDWMKKRIQERNVSCVIWKNVRGCDLWNAELQVARELLGVPVLGLDVTYSDIDSPRIQTRVEAFLESL